MSDPNRTCTGPGWCRTCAVPLGGPHRGHEYRALTAGGALIAVQAHQHPHQPTRIRMSGWGERGSIDLTVPQLRQFADMLADLLAQVDNSTARLAG